MHGVTTIAMGNCGVGFAPARPDRHDWLIGLLEGVEDIPGTALAEGMTWGWETFPEYLDVLERQAAHRRRRRARPARRAAHLRHGRPRRRPHRGTRPTTSSPSMARLVGEALDAGAIGFATSRTEVHRTKDGANIGTLHRRASPSCSRSPARMADAGHGVIQLISDCYQTPDDEFADAELALIEAIARTSGRPVSLHGAAGVPLPRPLAAPLRPGRRDARRRASTCKAQVAPRPIGVLLGLEATANPFLFTRGFGEVARLPLAERVAALARPGAPAPDPRRARRR